MSEEPVYQVTQSWQEWRELPPHTLPCSSLLAWQDFSLSLMQILGSRCSWTWEEMPVRLSVRLSCVSQRKSPLSVPSRCWSNVVILALPLGSVSYLFKVCSKIFICFMFWGKELFKNNFYWCFSLTDFIRGCAAIWSLSPPSFIPLQPSPVALLGPFLRFMDFCVLSHDLLSFTRASSGIWTTLVAPLWARPQNLSIATAVSGDVQVQAGPVTGPDLWGLWAGNCNCCEIPPATAVHTTLSWPFFHIHSASTLLIRNFNFFFRLKREGN